jgi:hypothetical protein
MDSIIDIISSNVYLFHSTIQENLLTVSDYDYIYHITDDLIEYCPLPALSLSPAIDFNIIEDTNMEKESIEKKRNVKSKIDLASMKIKELNIYIRDNNLNTKEVRELKKQRRRELNCIYARNFRSNK